MEGSMTAGLRRIWDVTPASRERYVDFLHPASIGIVVLGHYLGTVIPTSGGRIGQRIPAQPAVPPGRFRHAGRPGGGVPALGASPSP